MSGRPNDLLKQNPTVQGPVQNLRERELCLQDREIVTVAGFAILRFTNEEVLLKLDDVVARLEKFINLRRG